MLISMGTTSQVIHFPGETLVKPFFQVCESWGGDGGSDADQFEPDLVVPSWCGLSRCLEFLG